MICPTCKAENKKSRVYPGVSMTTCMYFAPFYDEDGKYHNHDGNTITTEYSCTEGHKWIDRGHNKCWCGWGEKDYDYNNDANRSGVVPSTVNLTITTNSVRALQFGNNNNLPFRTLPESEGDRVLPERNDQESGV